MRRPCSGIASPEKSRCCTLWCIWNGLKDANTGTVGNATVKLFVMEANVGREEGT